MFADIILFTYIAPSRPTAAAFLKGFDHKIKYIVYHTFQVTLIRRFEWLNLLTLNIYLLRRSYLFWLTLIFYW